MLLVNWKESKNLGKQTSYKTWGWVTIAPCYLLSFVAHAEEESYASSTSILSIFLSLLLVIGVVFMLAFLMRRFNVTQSGSSQLKVVASMMAGTRERVMVIEVGEEQHLVGVTAHNINHLAKLSNPLETNTPTNNSDKFKDKLSMYMAGKLNPSIKDKNDDENSQSSKPGAKQ